MTIRSRAFAAFAWLVLVSGAMTGLVVYSYRESERLQAQQQRQSEVLQLQATAWRALMEMKADQREFLLTGSLPLRDRRERDRRVYTSSIAQLSTMVDNPGQSRRLAAVRDAAESWTNTFTDGLRASTATIAESEIIIRESDTRFEPLSQALVAFETQERELMREAVDRESRRLATFTYIVGGLAGLGVVTILGLLAGTKRMLLDPLKRLTQSADRIGHGDFTAAHQTLRRDEIGVLFNSFATMAQAVQSREKELASALSESRRLAAASAEARALVEAAHAELMATIETVPAALFLYEAPSGLVRMRNHAAVEIFGVPPNDPALQSQYLSRFRMVNRDGSACPPEEWPEVRALRGEQVVGHELDIHHPDGRVFCVIASAAPLKNDLGHIVGAVVALQDIAKLREVDRLKDEFVSTVSHELRTPLTSIRGSVQLVLDEPGSVPDPEHQQLLQIALNNCERLVRIINDILDVAKIESGNVTLNRKACQVADLVRTSIQVVEGPARGAQVTLSASLPAKLPPVLVDSDRIVQALVNLLSNAVKFAPPNSTVTVGATVDEGVVKITVADQGDGIAPENLARLFRKFQQVDASSSRRRGGTGLGLVITKTLVELHGGRIWVNSEPKKGTTFTFTLPVAPAESAVALAPVAANKDGSARLAVRRVLVVDDDDDFRAVMRKQLTRAGYVVLDARDGASALHVARTTHPDVITVDLMMPGLDGWSFIERLREEPLLAHIPVVVVSGAPEAGAGRLPSEIPVVPKGEGQDRILREVGQALGSRRGATIVVAEDDDDLRGVLAASLARGGHRVIQARDGGEALAAIDRQRVDLVVLDLWMPNVDGFEVLERIRSAGDATIPVVVVSGGDRAASEVRALGLGANIFLTKPVDAAALTEEVTRLLTQAAGSTPAD